jgi:hypothetical protein
LHTIASRAYYRQRRLVPSLHRRWCTTSRVLDPRRSPTALPRYSSARGHHHVLQTPQVAAFVAVSNAQNDHLGIGVSGSGGSHGNCWTPCEADAPCKYSVAQDGATTKIALATTPIKAQSPPACVICMQGNKSGSPPLNYHLEVGLKQSQNQQLELSLSLSASLYDSSIPKGSLNKPSRHVIFSRAIGLNKMMSS